jgi:uncharacterized protein (TIGR03067 family)
MRASLYCILVLTGWLLGLDCSGQEPTKGPADLQGTWKLMSMQVGTATVDVSQGSPRWIIRGNKVIRDGKELAVLTTDPAATPKVIDLRFLATKRVYEGIYEVDGDTWNVCVNVETDGIKERPSRLSTKGQPDWRLLIFQRLKPGDPPEDMPGFVGMALRFDKDAGHVVVGQVLDGRPAQKAGLKEGDILLRIGAEEPREVRTVVAVIQKTRPGSEVVFRIRRDGKERAITVRPEVVPFMLLDDK